jgi:hypothetical protein
MGTQTKMAGVVGTPKQLRAILRQCREDVRAREKAVADLKTQAEAAKDAEDAAVALLEQAERDALEAADGSPESVDAERRETREWKRAKGARDSRRKVKATLKLAKAELKGALARLDAVRDDIEALQEGRRSG